MYCTLSFLFIARAGLNIVPDRSTLSSIWLLLRLQLSLSWECLLFGNNLIIIKDDIYTFLPEVEVKINIVKKIACAKFM